MRHTFRNVESTDDVNHGDIHFTCPIDASILLNAYQALLNQDNRQVICAGAAITLFLVSCAAIFGSAFTNCTKVAIVNKSPSPLYPLYAEPLGTKINSNVWLPYTDLTVTLNGINSYADVTLSNNQVLHFSHYGKKGVLKNGPDNRAIEPGYPKIVFWVCNQRYVKINAKNSNASANTDELRSDTFHTPAMLDYFTLPTNTMYLRGSRIPKTVPLITESERTQPESASATMNNTRFGFYHATHPTVPVEPEQQLTLSV